MTSQVSKWRRKYWRDSFFAFPFYVFDPFLWPCYVSPWYYYPCLPPYVGSANVVVVDSYPTSNWRGSDYDWDPGYSTAPNPELDASFLLFLNAVLGHCLSRQPEGRPTVEYLYQEFMEWEIMARQDLGIEEARGRSRIRRAVKSLSPMRGPPLPPSPPAYSPAKRRRSQSAGPSSRGSPAGWE